MGGADYAAGVVYAILPVVVGRALQPAACADGVGGVGVADVGVGVVAVVVADDECAMLLPPRLC